MTISLETLTTDPSGSENGLVVRNIPSGIQLVEIDDGYGNILGTNINPLIVKSGSTTRTEKTYYGISQIIPYNTEGMITLIPTSDFIVGSNGTSFGVTSSKTLKIQAIYANGTYSKLNLRIENSGTATVSSSLIMPLNSFYGGTSIKFEPPGGIELTGNMQFGLSGVQFSGPTFNADITIIGYEY
jgi:hypothetical protein